MSSVGVEGSGARQYYCHQCRSYFRTEAESSEQETTACPNCDTGFFEEVSAAPAQRSSPQQAQRFAPESLFETIHGLRPVFEGMDHQEGIIGVTNFVQGLHDLLAGVEGGEGWQQRQIHFLHPGMTMHSNPGDYVFGRGGIDAIVTQILDQPIEGTGPPPLDKEIIKTIPNVKITREQVDANLQCSVCWEDFVLGEPVRELKCEHHFHESCIIPWLELHGTCPVCRKPQHDEANQEESNSNDANNGSSSDSGMAAQGRLNPPTSVTEVFTSAVEQLLRTTGFIAQPSSRSQPTSSTTSEANGGASSSSNSSGESTSRSSERDSSSSDQPSHCYDFDLE